MRHLNEEYLIEICTTSAYYQYLVICNKCRTPSINPYIFKTSYNLEIIGGLDIFPFIKSYVSPSLILMYSLH